MIRLALAQRGVLLGALLTAPCIALGQTSSPAPSSPTAPTDGASSTTSSGNTNNTPPATTPAPNPPPSTPTPPRSFWDGFSFGSYGRVVVGTDLRGRVYRPTNIVAFGTRLDEQTYTELEVHRDDDFGSVHTRVVATLAITGPLFHESGTWNTQLAVRNLYIEERNAFTRGLALWIGSRMYRGDDIYLLNWWPLDNLNTVGGGARYDIGEHVTLYGHFGANRLDSNYQYQTLRIVPRDGVGAVNINILERPRLLGSLKATWWLFGRTARSGLKVSAYGEAHGLPDGVRQNTENGRRELLPSDWGVVAGAQVGLYNGPNFLNLFFRYAQGLGAYGDLSLPMTRNAIQTSARAQNIVLALSGNYEVGPFGVLLGAYVRSFRDADGALYGRNDLVEGTVSVRPTLWIGNHAGVSLEGNFQAIAYNMLDPVTLQGPRTATQWRFALMPFVTPAGRGTFTRPHLRAVYSLTVRDDGARRLYPVDDPFSANPLEHFLGLSCEWWFNSSYL